MSVLENLAAGFAVALHGSGILLRLLRGSGFTGPLIIELFDIPKKLRSRTRLLRLLAALPRAPGSAGGSRPGTPAPAAGPEPGYLESCQKSP